MQRSKISYAFGIRRTPFRLSLRPSPTLPSIVLTVFFIFCLCVNSASAASYDPLEPINRGTHHFNRVVDQIFLKPLAIAYRKVAPPFVKRGMRNFFGNLNDVKVGINHLAQLKLEYVAVDFSRVLINSTIGVGGVIDIADSGFGLTKNNQDFGLTLAHFGISPGPYLVLPFLGPSTFRDAIGQGIDIAIDPMRSLDHVPTRNALGYTRATEYRSRLLPFDELATGDSYLFLREAYLQRREYLTDKTYASEKFYAKR